MSSPIHVGISGYSYKEWQGEGLFYPTKLKQREYLACYSKRYDTVEAVGTWAHMPSEATVARWIAETPEGFTVSPKMHKNVTHFGRLKPGCVPALVAFVELLEPLENAGKLGPVLLQLPPNLKRNDDLLASFLAAVPKRPSLRFSVEFRDASWNASEVQTLLWENGVAWVVADTDEGEPEIRATAGHVYVRLRRTEYSDEHLEAWAERFRSWADGGQTVFVYCRHKDVVAPWVWADRIVEFCATG